MAAVPTIRPMTTEDISPVNTLFEKVFQKTRSPGYWMWKYFNNPHGDAIVSLGELDGNIVGLYGLVPRKAWWLENQVTAWQEVDLMVDPDHSKGGLFKRLGRASYDRVTAEGHPFTFGFPNQTSLPLGRRILGWRAISPIPLWTLLLRPSKVLTGKVPPLPGAAFLSDFAFRTYHSIRLGSVPAEPVNVGTTFPADVDKLTCNRNAELEFIRDAAYLNWRYTDCPYARYRIYSMEDRNGTTVVAVVGLGEEHRANLCDLMYHPDNTDQVPGLLRWIATDCYNSGCYSLRAWAIEGNPEAAFFASCGFFNRNALNFHVIRSFNSPEKNRRLWDPVKWFISAGDSDCV